LLPTITANVPVYTSENQQLLGVCATDVILSEELNTFLKSLEISSSGIAFIMDTSGLLIASSTPEPITTGQGQDTVRLAASDSDNTLIRDSVNYLKHQYQALTQVESSQLDFVQDNDRYYVQIARFADGLGLDWILVLAMPESDFMEPIDAQNRITVVLYVLSLLLATAIGLLLATWMTGPLHRLSDYAKSIAHGHWREPMKLDRSDAIGDLSRSLATMAKQLQESLTTLEHRVEERNQELTQLNRELQKLVNVDGLTETANRRHFDTVFEQEWRRLARDQQPLSLLLCDIDYFKRYNDTYGHQAGDQCLQEVARVFTQVVQRPADIVARYGGEEFAIILPNTDEAGAVRLAQQIQQHLHNLAIPHNSSSEGQITISIGIATVVPSLKESSQDLITIADQALYDAKAKGRNGYSTANAST
jgi:diguanylate cyclase (GGDEF)-like protein